MNEYVNLSTVYSTNLKSLVKKTCKTYSKFSLQILTARAHFNTVTINLISLIIKNLFPLLTNTFRDVCRATGKRRRTPQRSF